VILGDSGDPFVAGYTLGVLENQASAGGHDAFAVRFSRSGERLWTHQWGTSEDDYVYGAARGKSAVFVAGYTEGAFEGASNAGEADAFISKLDDDGNLLWTRQLGTSATDYAQALHVDAAGAVLVTGYLAGDFGFDPDLGAEDAFLAKFTADGDLLWLRQWGSDTTDYALSVSSDKSGDIYVTGYTYGAVAETVAGGEDPYLTKFDAQGNLIWSRQWGTFTRDSARSVAVDAASNIIVVGDTEGALGGHKSAGERDAFLTRFSPDGIQIFNAQWGSSAREFSLSVAIAARHVYVTGYVESRELTRDALLSKWRF
jgi:hypothetical protein